METKRKKYKDAQQSTTLLALRKKKKTWFKTFCINAAVEAVTFVKACAEVKVFAQEQNIEGCLFPSTSHTAVIEREIKFQFSLLIYYDSVKRLEQQLAVHEFQTLFERGPVKSFSAS